MRASLTVLFLSALGILHPVPGLCGQDPGSPRVEKLAIRGNRALSDGEIRQLMQTRAEPWYGALPGVGPRTFDPAVFRADVARIRAHYVGIGFHDAVVDTVVERYPNNTVRLRIQLTEGDPVRVSAISINGLAEVSTADSVGITKTLRTRPGLRLNRQNLEADRDVILRRLGDSGFAFAKVAAEMAVHRDTRLADVRLTVHTGPRCRFGQVWVQGRKRASERLVMRGLDFSTGQPFRRRKLQSSQRQLYRSGVFRSVALSFPDSVAEESPVDIVVSVSERLPRRMKLGLGYDTEEQVRGSLAWLHRNVWGGGTQVSVESAASALETQGTVSVVHPYILGSKTWLKLTGFVEHQRPVEVRVKRVGGSASLERTFRTSGRLIFQVRTELIDFKSDSARTTFLIEFQGDTRDDYFDPQRGVLAYVALKGSAFPDLLKLTAEGRWYRRMTRRNVLALRVSGGTALHPGSVDALPNFERYFAGGANSVRGWSLNHLSPRDAQGLPVGGRSLLEGSVELRTRLMPFLGMALFLDAGSVGLGRFDAFDPDALRTSAGAGVRYLSPIGPMRLDFSSRLSQDRYVPKWRIYFSLGQAF